MWSGRGKNLPLHNEKCDILKHLLGMSTGRRGEDCQAQQRCEGVVGGKEAGRDEE